MNERVCAVVVTFNRKELLRKCLLSLGGQTRPLDKIVIIDNASTDGTPDLLKTEFPELTTVRLPVNTGGAGGFHAGMKWAFEQGYDWIWVMDDDIETVPNALEVMIGYGAIGDLIQSRKKQVDGPLIWESLWDVSAASPVGFRSDVSFDNGKEWISISYANFEGALIKRKVIEKIGYPDRRYFMMGDDTIYGFLASLHFHVIYINFFGIDKKVKIGELKRPLHLYLQFRNRFLNFEHFRAAGLPVSRSVFLWRFLLDLQGAIRSNLRNRTQYSKENIRVLIQAFRDGRSGRFGKPPFLK